MCRHHRLYRFRLKWSSGILWSIHCRWKYYRKWSSQLLSERPTHQRKPPVWSANMVGQSPATKSQSVQLSAPHAPLINTDKLIARRSIFGCSRRTNFPRKWSGGRECRRRRNRSQLARWEASFCASFGCSRRRSHGYRQRSLWAHQSLHCSAAWRQSNIFAKRRDPSPWTT